MSRRRLRNWTCWSIVWFVLYSSAYIAARLCTCVAAEILATLVPLAVAIPAAVLVGAFNRRNSYLSAMRDLWHNLVPAAQGAIQYTHLACPSQADFADTQRALSTAIDRIRAVFDNVPNGSPSGLYPYENIKDIAMVISWLGFGSDFRKADAIMARKCITRLWQQMHGVMLDEFDRDVPMTPVGKYLDGGGDPRSLADLLIEGCLSDEDMDRKRRPSAPRSNERS